MTPQERATQIWCTPYMASKVMDVELCELIAAQIEEAEREAVGKEEKEHIQGMLREQEASYKEGFRAAKEKAKGIAMDFPYSDQNSGYEIKGVADLIGKMEPDK